jgi:hypothetical protein
MKGRQEDKNHRRNCDGNRWSESQRGLKMLYCWPSRGRKGCELRNACKFTVLEKADFLPRALQIE